MIVFQGDRTDDDVAAALERACSEIERLNGVVIQRDALGRRSFARPMKKCDNGHYIRVTFELPPENIDTLLARYKLAGDVFRIQVTCAPEHEFTARVEESGSSRNDDRE